MLVVGAALLVVVPTSVGMLRDPGSDTGSFWCGTWLLKGEPSDCPGCCADFGVYDDRGSLAGWIIAVGLTALAVGWVLSRFVGRAQADPAVPTRETNTAA